MIIKSFCEDLPKNPNILIKDMWENIPTSLRPVVPIFVLCESLFCGFTRMSLNCGFPFNGKEDEETFDDWKSDGVWAWATKRFDGKYFVFLGMEERLRNGRKAFCQGVEFAIYHELGHVYHWSKLCSTKEVRDSEDKEELFANAYATIMLSHYYRNGKYNGYYEKYPKSMLKFISLSKNIDLSNKNGITETKKILKRIDGES